MSLAARDTVINPNEDSWENRVKFFTEVSTQTFVQTATRVRDVSLKKGQPFGLKKGTGKAIEISITAAGVVTGGFLGTSEGSKAGKLVGKGVTQAINAYLRVS